MTSGWAAIALIAGLTACASGGAGAGGASGQGSTKNPNLITVDELAGSSASNAYDAIQMLRPQMLVAQAVPSSGGGGGGRGRTASSGSASISVYRDDTKMGDVTALKSIAVGGIKQIRFYRPEDAESKFGLESSAGVIQLVTR
jgi:hypothetical protein